jgi:antitoxin (DNA-binding transcriptional repressor) of toxin-antitoxin stability system
MLWNVPRRAVLVRSPPKVGVAQLRRELKDWLERPQSGYEVLITERRRPVVHLNGIDIAPYLGRLVEQGHLSRPARSHCGASADPWLACFSAFAAGSSDTRSADLGVAVQGVSPMCRRVSSPMMVPRWGAARNPPSDTPDRRVEARTHFEEDRHKGPDHRREGDPEVTATSRNGSRTISTILFVVAAVLLAATVALGWFYGTHRSPDGHVMGQTATVSSDGYAIASPAIDLGGLPDEWIPTYFLGTFRVAAESDGEAPLFVGVGPSADVAAYLADVEYTEVTDIEAFGAEVIRIGSSERASRIEHTGSATPQPPASLDFWTVSTQGQGPQTLDWEPESGAWTLVIMNSDAASGVDITTSVGVNTPWILIGLVILGLMTLSTAIGAVILAVVASRRPAPATEPTSTQPSPLSG